MFESLDPRKVAAKKIARLVEQAYLAKHGPSAARARGEARAKQGKITKMLDMVSGEETQLDSLESLLQRELEKYDLSLDMNLD